MADIEVVIATRNRHTSLLACLEALAGQTVTGFRTVVIDDGSEPPVESVIPERLRQAIGLRVLRQPERSGPGAARNRGVESSTAEYIVFIDDDVRATARVIESHIRAMEEATGPLATLGPLTAPRRWQPSPWTLWEAKKLALEYGRMEAGQYEPAWRHFHTGNACVRRSDFVAAGGFDEQFTRAEDVELALRMAKLGVRFAFLPEAIGWHHAERTLASWLDIPRQYGTLHVKLDTLHPEIDWLATVRREQARRHPLLRSARALCRLPGVRPAAVFAAAAAARALLAVRLSSASLYAMSFIYDVEYNDALGRAADSAPPSVRAARA